MKIRKFRIKIPCCIVALVWCIAIPATTFAQLTAQGQGLIADSSAGAPGKPDANSPATANTATVTNAEVLAELERMRARIQELEAQLKAQTGTAAVAESAAITE